jgi:hypothetical protein
MRKQITDIATVWPVQVGHAIFAKSQRHIFGTDVLAEVAHHCEISAVSIIAQRRGPQFVEARHIAMFFVRRFLGKSLVETGRIIGNRDHSTVSHGVTVVTTRLEQEPGYAAFVEAIWADLCAGPRPRALRKPPADPTVDTSVLVPQDVKVAAEIKDKEDAELEGGMWTRQNLVAMNDRFQRAIGRERFPVVGKRVRA